MFITALILALLGNGAVDAPISNPCYTDPTSGLEVCTQPVEPQPRPELS